MLFACAGLHLKVHKAIGTTTSGCANGFDNAKERLLPA